MLTWALRMDRGGSGHYPWVQAKEVQMPRIGYALSTEEHAHVYVHQVGPDQESFLDFYRSEILPSHRPLATAGSKP